jgi:apolipoprotein N-acyltransferase
MGSKFFRFLKNLLLALLSSLLLVLSFPRFDLGFLAWVGLLPLLIAINGKSLKYGFFLSFICGVLFFVGIFYWIFEITKFTLLHAAVLALYVGPFFGLFGLMFNFISTRWGITPALFAAPFIWVPLEYIRSNLSFLALPWGLLAHSQYQYPVVIQIASFTGTYSISFLIVMVNCAIAAVVLVLFHPHPRIKYGAGSNPPPSKGEGKTGDLPHPRGRGIFSSKATTALVVITALLMILTLLYGDFVISQPINGNKIKISVVQGNIEQGRKWDRRYAREIMQTYAELTEEASKDQPTLIIWPETATPGSISENFRLYIEVRNIVKKAGTHLLLGSAQYQKFGEAGSRQFKYLNSAFLISPEPRLGKNQRYDKIHLFPFGEYLPFKEIIPWSYINVPNISEYTPGKEFTVFELPGFRFGVIICWENVFPELVRKFVRKGGQFMVNITNEAWFGKTAAPYQLLSMSVFRAVENRIFFVRCANTGVSCIIDPYGRIVDRLKNQNGQDIFVRGVMSGWIIPLDSKTIYTRYGEWFVWVTILGAAVFLVVAWRHKRMKRMAEENAA